VAEADGTNLHDEDSTVKDNIVNDEHPSSVEKQPINHASTDKSRTLARLHNSRLHHVCHLLAHVFTFSWVHTIGVLFDRHHFTYSTSTSCTAAVVIPGASGKLM